MGLLNTIGVNMPANYSRIATDALVIYGLLYASDNIAFIGNIIQDDNQMKENAKMTAYLLTAPIISNFLEARHWNL